MLTWSDGRRPSPLARSARRRPEVALGSLDEPFAPGSVGRTAPRLGAGRLGDRLDGRRLELDAVDLGRLEAGSAQQIAAGGHVAQGVEGPFAACLALREGPRPGQSPEVARPVEADEDLAQEPLAAGGLAARPQDLDRDLGHGLLDVRQAEDRRLRLRRERVERHVAARAWPARRGAARRHEFEGAADGIARLGQHRAGQPIAGLDAAQRAGHEALGAAGLEEHDDARIGRQDVA